MITSKKIYNWVGNIYPVVFLIVGSFVFGVFWNVALRDGFESGIIVFMFISLVIAGMGGEELDSRFKKLERRAKRK